MVSLEKFYSIEWGYRFIQMQGEQKERGIVSKWEEKERETDRQTDWQRERERKAEKQSKRQRKRKRRQGLNIPFNSMNWHTTLDKKKNHRGDASCDIEESAVRFRRDASMREVAAVTSRIRSRFRSWIKHCDSSISQDSDFMHQQHGSFFCPG